MKCFANQWTGFDMIGAFIMKKLRKREFRNCI